MRLRRIQAVKFGNVDGVSLGDLSPRLTVVHGPNEAGKSSLTALVRYVLYGFPTEGSVSEPPYLPVTGGTRQGRLIFSDGGSDWIIDRMAGTKGGPVEVRGPDGTPRHSMLTELTGSISKSSYRRVYGFGLSDLHQIEELKGKEDDLFQQLYAASAGLGARLIDARSGLDDAMNALWKKGGTASVLNRAKTERAGILSEIRALQGAAESLRADAVRLEEMGPILDAVRARRDETQGRAEQLSRTAAEVERLLAQAAAARNEAERLEREVGVARAATAGAEADADVLKAASVIDELAEELSGYREQASSLGEQEARLTMLDARLRAAVADTGWSQERALAAATDAGVAEEIKAAGERFSKARMRFEVAVDGRDAARAEGAGVAATTTAASRPWLIPGLVVAGIGIVGAVAGLVIAQSLLAAFAGALVVVGVVLALVGGGAAPAGGTNNGRIAASEAECAAAEQALGRIGAEWGDWVRSRGLGDGSEDPAAIAARYQAARTVREMETERADVAQACARSRESAERYASRVRDSIAPLLGEAPASVTADRVPEVVNRGRALVAQARQAAALSAEARARTEALESEAGERRVEAEIAVTAVASALQVVGAAGYTLEQVRAMEVAARTAASDAADESDRLSGESAQLRARIGAERRDTALGELRLAEVSVNERIAAGVREYAVLAVASRLLAQTQARYERDRQPEVVKRAEAAFSLMTEGRYTRISVPLGKDAIEVFDAASRAISPGHLSRGTAEQLYLALRIGLIEQAGEMGADLPVLMDDVLVDFSPKRAEQAARAIADLAQRRQVVFFTCHPGTADMLCAVAPDAVRLELAPPS